MTIDPDSIPRIDLTMPLTSQWDSVRGKTAVIAGKRTADDVRLVKSGSEQAAVAHILAAETLLAKRGQSIPVGFLPLIFGLLLYGCAQFSSKRRRKVAYILLIASMGALVPITALLGVQAFFSYPMVMLGIYAALRSVSLYEQRHLLVDSITGLPNFAALRRDLRQTDETRQIGVAVIKILRLDGIFATLTLREKRHYLKMIARRLAVVDPTQKVYFDDGKYFAFLTQDAGETENKSHLTGLRAIVSQPVEVAGRLIDVAITIGGDFRFEDSGEDRLSSAISAADQAREAFRPVFLVSDFENSEDHWDHGLTSRLAEALAQDRIKIKLQPQVDLRTSQFVGAEALARWKDESGGEIPPASFIPQCERMGRLDELTKRVLERSLNSLQVLQNAGHDLPISINLSAIQLVDDRIVEIIESRIASSGIVPSKLKLEITETARIEDFAAARSVMEKLRALGISFSLDDFGVGSANLEAVQRLPFHELKIDRCFVSELRECKMSRAIVSGVLRLAESANISTVAEGIGDIETYDLLADMGCERGQGFFIARPQVLSQLVSTLDLRKGGLFHKSVG